VRSLAGRDLLEIDKSRGAGLALLARESGARQVRWGDRSTSRRSAQRSRCAAWVILDAIVEAFEADPATPLLVLRTDQVDIVRHPHWAIEPDVVRMHDLRQLEELRLIGWDGTTEFFPTPTGRMASKNPAAFLAQRAEEIEDAEERSRLRRMAEKFRAGDIGVSVVVGLTGAAIRTALGL
jgi:hypothetical protein